MRNKGLMFVTIECRIHCNNFTRRKILTSDEWCDKPHIHQFASATATTNSSRQTRRGFYDEQIVVTCSDHWV